MTTAKETFTQAYRTIRFATQRPKERIESVVAWTQSDPARNQMLAKAAHCWLRRSDWPGGGIAHSKLAPDAKTCINVHLNAIRHRRAERA